MQSVHAEYQYIAVDQETHLTVMSFTGIFVTLSLVISITIAIPLDTTIPPDISITTLKTDSSSDIVATSSVETNDESSEQTNVFMNEELELLAINLPSIFRRDASKMDESFPSIGTAAETLDEYEQQESSPETHEPVFPEPIDDEDKIEKRDVHIASFKDTHSPDPNFPKYLNRRKKRNSLSRI